MISSKTRAPAAEATFAEPRTRLLTVLGQDPTLADAKGVVTVQVEIPRERLVPGPQGSRFHVIDCDAATRSLYRPVDLGDDDAFRATTSRTDLEKQRAFHAQNVYATAMEALGRFEKALGRRVPWSIPGGSLERAGTGHGHVLKLAPHAFSEANAYYSRRDEGILFGYFPSVHRADVTVFTCLSHDVVMHETTHALLDGLHPRYTDPSSDDQAAFHEGFADIVALLSGFRHRRVVNAAFKPEVVGSISRASRQRMRQGWIPPEALKPDLLRRSVLLGLADQLGDELVPVRGNALRRSAEITPSRSLYGTAEYAEPHKRGELLVAAVMNAFLSVWVRRLRPLQGADGRQHVARDRVVEEGAEAADHLLTMAIRALDYAAPVDIDFPDYLTALLTADHEVYPDDSKYNYRKILVEWFGKYGIDPVQSPSSPAPGMWAPPKHPVSYRRSHFESLIHDPDEAYQFIWENHDALGLQPEAFTYVPSVRPCVRTDTDGFTIRETLIQYVQILAVEARELSALGLRAPDRMPLGQKVTLYGGGVLVFDEFGRLKFHVATGVRSKKQNARLQSLWNHGFFRKGIDARRRFADLHRARAMGQGIYSAESW